MAKSDFSQMKEFTQKLQRLATGAEQEKFYQECARELAARFLAKVIKRTPVGVGTFEAKTDKKGKTRFQRVSAGGTLRRGWTARTEAEALSSGGKNPAAYAQTMLVQKTGKTYEITIINPVSYASYVEYGHRQTPGRYVPAIGKKLKAGWVKGHFMMTISADELQSEAPGILEKRFADFLKEVLKGK
ncbi:MAG TPA: HK97 gp10 family phage protein [Selenomonadales bacterium]|nr:HK97 gp10 family phage protein [Selenomonadales bacterium]